MKLKTTIALSLAAIAFAGVISGCGGDKKPAASSAAVKNEISVGITPGYSEQVMEYAAKEAAKQGLTVNIKTFSDYVTPDQALAAGDIDLNSFQHGRSCRLLMKRTGPTLFPSEIHTSHAPRLFQ